MTLFFVVISVILASYGSPIQIHASILSTLNQLKVENPLKFASYEKEYNLFKTFSQEDVEADDFKEAGNEILELYIEELNLIKEIKALEERLNGNLSKHANVAHLDIVLKDINVGHHTALKEELEVMLNYFKVLSKHEKVLEIEIAYANQNSVSDVVEKYWGDQAARQMKRIPRMQSKWLL